MKKITSIIISAAIILSGVIGAAVLPATALAKKKQKWPAGIDVSASSAIVIDYDTGVVLYEKDPDTPRYPASITKIMTALIACENCKMDEVVTFSEDAVMLNEGDTSHISRDINEQMTMEECLYGMMLESANECAWAIGEHTAGGDINKFVSMMNDKAKKLGCKNTNFQNPNGLPDENHVVSARDMATISRAAFKNKDFRKICGTSSYSIPPTNKHDVPTLLNNHHAMLHPYQTAAYVYEGCLGGKTGYTVAAGGTLVTYASRGDMTLVCVVMNCTPPNQYIDSINLFDYCFSGFNKFSVSDNESLFTEKTEKSGPLSTGANLIELAKDGTVILPSSASFSDAKLEIDPLDKETNTAKMTYTYGGRTVGTAQLAFKEKTNVGFPFNNIPKSQGGSGEKYIRIDYLSLIAAVAILIVLFLIGRFLVINGIEMGFSITRQYREQKKMKNNYKGVRKNSRKTTKS